MPIILLTAFIISYFIHLSARFPALGAMRLDLLLGIAACAAIFLQPTRDKMRLNVPTSRRLVFFLAYIIISLPLVTWPGSVIRENLQVWVKAAFFFILVVGAVRTEGQLKWIMFIFLGCQAFRILEPLYLHITEGYWGDIAYTHFEGKMSGLNRLSGAPKDVVNPNQLAWVIINTIPFLFYLCWQNGKFGKMIFLMLTPPFSYALLLTGSRSGIVSLAIVISGIVLISERKLLNLLVSMAIVFPIAIYMFSSADADLQTRYRSLVDSSVAGADTKQGRINALINQLGSIANNPLFGNGLGTSYETNANVLAGRAQITHNLYIEIIQEAGIIGFSLFTAYIVTMVRALAKARHVLKKSGCKNSDWLYRLISATLVWIIMDLVYSIACFGINSWEWYFFGGIATVCLVLTQDRIDKQQSPQGVTA